MKLFSRKSAKVRETGQLFISQLESIATSGFFDPKFLQAMEQTLPSTEVDNRICYFAYQQWVEHELTCHYKAQQEVVDKNENQRLKQHYKDLYLKAYANKVLNVWLDREQLAPKKLEIVAMKGLEIAMAQGYGVTVRKMLKAIPLKKRNALLSKTDEKGWTLLHKAAQSSSAEVIKAILCYFPTPEKKLAAIRQFTKEGETALHLAVSSANCAKVTAIWDAHSSNKERLQTLTLASSQNKPLFPRLASLSGKLLIRFLALFPDDASRLAAIRTVDEEGKTILETIMKLDKPELIKVLIQAHSNDQEWYETLTIRKNGSPLLHRLIYYANENNFLALLTANENTELRLALMWERDWLNSTLLHRIALRWWQWDKNPTFATALLAFYPTANARLAAIQAQDNHGYTMLHYLRKWTSGEAALKIILASLPTDADRLQTIMITNQQQESILHRTVTDAELLNYLLAYYPSATARIQAIESVNSSGEDVLYLAAKYDSYDPVKLLLELYPPNERWEVVHRSRQRSSSLLNEVTKPQLKVSALRAILEELPPKTSSELLNTLVKQGLLAQQKLMKLENCYSLNRYYLMLLCCPEHQRFKLLTDCLPNYWSGDPKLLMLFKLLPGGELFLKAAEYNKSLYLMDVIKLPSARLVMVKSLFSAEQNLAELARLFEIFLANKTLFLTSKSQRFNFWDEPPAKPAETFEQVVSTIRKLASDKLMAEVERTTEDADRQQLLQWALAQPLFKLLETSPPAIWNGPSKRW